MTKNSVLHGISLLCLVLPTWQQAEAQDEVFAPLTVNAAEPGIEFEIDSAEAATEDSPLADSEPSTEPESLEYLHQDIFEIDENPYHDPWLWPLPTPSELETQARTGVRPRGPKSNPFLSSMRENGIAISGRTTQFAFGLAGGIDRLPAGPVALPGLGMGNVFKYTGRGELDAIVDLEKWAGLRKGSLLMRLEHWYGEYGNVSLNAGTLSPAVFGAFFPPRPNQPGVPFLTSFLWTQPLSRNLVAFAGKRVMIGAVDQDIFAGGNGTQQFSNQSLCMNPMFILAVPYSTLSAGFVSPQSWGTFGLYVADATDRTADFFGTEGLFSHGLILGGEVKVRTKFFGLPGQHHVGGLWNHVPLTDLRFQSPPPGVYPEPEVPGFPTINDSYILYYGFDQYFVDFGDGKRGWGLFGRAAISDGNPIPVKYTLSCGIGGDSPLRRERGDRFGLGWYFNAETDAWGPIPRAALDPGSGTGVELFYNIQVKPWLTITPDIQYVRPTLRAISTEDAFVYGLRINAAF